MSHVKISLPRHGHGTIEIDGVEVEGVHSIEIKAGVGNANEVVLHLYAKQVEIDGQYEVTSMEDVSPKYVAA